MYCRNTEPAIGLGTIAEGVETVAQRDVLVSVGCDFIQGYLYAKPMPAAHFPAYVQPAHTCRAQEPV